MAISIDNLGNSANPDINNGANACIYTNSSWTPPGSGLVIAFASSREAAGNNGPPTVCGNNLAWTQIKTDTFQAGDCRSTLFAADATGGVSGSTTVDFAGVLQLNCDVSFLAASGVDLSGGVAAAFVQTPSASGVDTSGSIALAAAAHPDNRPIAYFWNLANASLFERTNWTEIDSLQGVGPNRGLLSQYRGDAFETVSSASWASSVDWGGIAAELKATVGEEEAVTVPHRRVERLPHYRM